MSATAKVRAAWELEADFSKLVELAKAGELPDDVARDVLALAAKKARRRIHVVDKSGAIVRDTNEVELAIGVIRAKEIGFGVVHGVTTQTVCAGWRGKCPKRSTPPKRAFRPQKIAARAGEPWRCRLCVNRKILDSITPEQRRAFAQKARMSWTPEQRSEATRKAHEAQTPERRSEILHKAWATRRAKRRQVDGEGSPPKP